MLKRQVRFANQDLEWHVRRYLESINSNRNFFPQRAKVLPIIKLI